MGKHLVSAELEEVLETLEYSGAAPRFTASITKGQLPGPLYQSFKKVLAAIGGKWESRKQVHSFPHDPRPLVQRIIEQGFVPDLNPLDFFPTPPALVEPIIRAVQDDLEYVRSLRSDGATDRILEPSAGAGAFSDAMAAIAGSEAVLNLELNPVNVGVLRSKGHTVEEVDFLQWSTEERFRLIVMNPPFDKLTWLRHIQHAYQFLAPGGQLVCIAPSSACANVDFVKWALARGTIEPNEERAFRSSGTNTSTVTIFLRWEGKAEDRRPNGNYPSYEAHLFDVTISSDSKYHERMEGITTCYLAAADSFQLGASSDAYSKFADDLKALAQQVMLETLTKTDLDDSDCRYFAQWAYENRPAEADLPTVRAA